MVELERIDCCADALVAAMTQVSSNSSSALEFEFAHAYALGDEPSNRLSDLPAGDSREENCTSTWPFEAATGIITEPSAAGAPGFSSPVIVMRDES